MIGHVHNVQDPLRVLYPRTGGLYIGCRDGAWCLFHDYQMREFGRFRQMLDQDISVTRVDAEEEYVFYGDLFNCDGPVAQSAVAQMDHAYRFVFRKPNAHTLGVYTMEDLVSKIERAIYEVPNVPIASAPTPLRNAHTEEDKTDDKEKKESEDSVTESSAAPCIIRKRPLYNRIPYYSARHAPYVPATRFPRGRFHPH